MLINIKLKYLISLVLLLFFSNLIFGCSGGGGNNATNQASSLEVSSAVITAPSSPSSLPTLWAKTYGGITIDWASSIQQTIDGEYIVGGICDGVTYSHIWLNKLNPYGEIVWQKAYGDGNFIFIKGYSLQQTTDGGYIIAGSYNNSSTDDADNDFLVFKTDLNGNIIWRKTYGGNKADTAYSVWQTTDGGYIVTGESKSFNNINTTYIWVIKLNSSGEIIWQKLYGRDTLYSGARSIKQTTDGGYIVTGTTESFSGGSNEIWILKLNSEGEILWQKICGEPSMGYSKNERAYTVQQTTDEGYIVAGSKEFVKIIEINGGATVSITCNAAWVIKFNSGGNIVWQKTYGDNGSTNVAYSIYQTSDGGYAVAGQKDSDMLVFKLDSSGDLTWQKAYGGDTYNTSESANSIQQTTDGKYVVAGRTSCFGAGQSDFWVLKIDSNGNIPKFGETTNIASANTDINPTSPEIIVSDSNITPKLVDFSTKNNDVSTSQQAP